MSTPLEKLERLVELVGADVLIVTDPRSTWPAEADLMVGVKRVPVAIHLAPIGLSHRGRDEVERRFQNPGSRRPVEDRGPERPPLLFGLWEQDPLLGSVPPVLAMADPVRRFNHMTRFSIFTKLAMLREAGKLGWAQGVSTTGEELLAFSPPLLPVAFEQQQARIILPPAILQTVVDSSGLLDARLVDPTSATERAVRNGLVVVRDAKFSRAVRQTYRGRCAMCGLGLGLTQAAHIYPVAAPGSTDLPSNGLALCANHHVAFDHHDVAVVPETGAIVFKPSFVETSNNETAARLFIGGTAPLLAAPCSLDDRPQPETFRMRYRYFEEKYDVSYEWMPPPGAPPTRQQL